jgi:hypothetical protein
VKCQGPITPLGVLCENSLGSTNVTSLVVNIEGANGFFLSPNYLKFRDHDLVGGFPLSHLINGSNDGYYGQMKVQTSSNN